MKKKNVEQDFVKAAKQAVSGLDTSHVMLGVWGDSDKIERWQFILQIGYALLHGKPIILIVPDGIELPEKLEGAVEIIERYRGGDAVSMKAASRRALQALGLTHIH